MSLVTAVRMLSQSKYRNQDQAKKQLAPVLKNYRNLEMKQEMYTHTTGKMEELVGLIGTIPVTYRGSVYNIPVAIYLLKDFPNSPPICYVKPTASMIIKQTKNVDGSGRVYLPYLSSWTDASDLLGVIQVMICIFGESPPLYQKPKEPYAASKVSDNCPYPRQPVSTPGYPPASSSGYPPYPPYPSATSPATGGYPPAPSTYGGYPPYPVHPPVNPTFATPASPTSSSNFSATVSQDHIKASLISAIEEQVKKKTEEKVSQKEAEIEVLRNTHVDLEKGSEKLNEMLSRMETDLVVITESKRLFEEKNRQFTDVIHSLENSTDKTPNIDEAFGPLEPLFKQLLNAYAEENAITDAMHYLLEALQKGTIDLDQFLKNTRELSRKQFMQRALVHKCRERAGLPY